MPVVLKPDGLQREPASETSRHAEVSRILQAKSAREVLGLVEGTHNSTGWRRAYLQKSLMVHPDKCKHPQAGEAFRRLTDAYKHLTVGTPWHFSHDGFQESSPEGNATGNHSRSATVNTPRGRGDNFNNRTGDEGYSPDPFDFFARAAREAFQAGDISQETFSRMFEDLLSKPAVATVACGTSGALVGAAFGKAVGSLLGEIVDGVDSTMARSSCRCRHSPYGRCGACRTKMARGTSGSAEAGGIAGLLIGSVLGAVVGGISGATAAGAASFKEDADGSHAP